MLATNANTLRVFPDNCGHLENLQDVKEMEMRGSVGIVTFIGALAFSQQAWAGPEWVEQGDAGRLVDAAQPTTGSGSISKIRGTLTADNAVNGVLGVSDYHDMYVIFIADPANFTATTVVEPDGPTQFDSRLFLFRLDGTGLLGNDDTVIIDVPGLGLPTVDGSFLTNAATDGTGVVVNEPGLYVLAVTNFAEYPTSGEFNQRIFEFDSSVEISGPDGPGGSEPIDDWENNLDAFTFGGLSGEYEILLNGVELIETGPLFVPVDLKPGQCPNRYLPIDLGFLSVSLPGTDFYDINDVDVSSITICRSDGVGGSVSPYEGIIIHTRYVDNTTPYYGIAYGCHKYGKDGFTDISLKFRRDELNEVLELDELPAGCLVELRIYGDFEKGGKFWGRDWLRILPWFEHSGFLEVMNDQGDSYVEVWPPDIQQETGGHGSFVQEYPLGTVVQLSVPEAPAGFEFVGWKSHGREVSLSAHQIQYSVQIGKTPRLLEPVFRPLPTTADR